MLRAIAYLVCGGLAGGVIGALAGDAFSGPILGSMLALVGMFVGAFAGWLWSLLSPTRPDAQQADYDDAPAPPGP